MAKLRPGGGVGVAPSAQEKHSATSRTKTTARRWMSAERREAMLQRLEELFLTEGFRELTSDDIAARLQCSKSTLYAVASSKEELVNATIRHFFRDVTAVIEARVARIENPRDRIVTYLASVGDGMRRMSSACYNDMIDLEATDMIYQLNCRASARRVRELIHEGVQAGCFRPVHAEFIAEAARLLIDGIMDEQLLKRTGLSFGDAYVELSTLVLAALIAD